MAVGNTLAHKESDRFLRFVRLGQLHGLVVVLPAGDDGVLDLLDEFLALGSLLEFLDLLRGALYFFRFASTTLALLARYASSFVVNAASDVRFIVLTPSFTS